MFEIKFVEDELQFYPLSQQMSYKLRCEAFDFSYESIDTDTRADLVEDQSPMVEILSDIDPSTADNFTVEESTDLVLDRSEKNVFGEY